MAHLTIGIHAMASAVAIERVASQPQPFPYVLRPSHCVKKTQVQDPGSAASFILVLRKRPQDAEEQLVQQC